MKGITCPKCGEYIQTTARKKELEAKPATKADLHRLVSSIFDVQEMRLRFEGRFRATKETRYALYADRLLSVESQLKDDAEEQAKLYPIHEWIIAQKGLSYDLAGQLIGLIQDIKKFDNVSKLHAYFGLGVIDYCTKCKREWLPQKEKAERILHIKKRQQEQEEKKKIKTDSEEVTPAESMVCNCEHPQIKRKAQKKIKGVMLNYNPDAKMVALGKVGTQFIKQGDLYRHLYEQFRNEYQERDDLKTEIESKKGKVTKNGESKGTAHVHKMANRKMVKIFLQHLWVIWRELEGLPVTMPYAISVLGHGDYIPPPSPSAKDIMDEGQKLGK